VTDSHGVVLEYSRRIDLYGAALGPDGSWRWELLVHPDDLAAASDAWQAALTEGLTYEHEHRLLMADGEYRWHLSRGIAAPAPDGSGTLWYGTATDIHAVRDAEDRLQRTQSALALAMRGGKIGWWQRDLRTEDVTWSAELEDLFGLPPGSFAGDRNRFLEFVHEDDRAAITAAVQGAIASGNDYVIEFRFRHADGTWGWMEGRGRATYEDGRPLMLYGIGMDISDRKAVEDTISTREERFRLAAKVGGFGLYDFDLVTGATYWSPELRAMLQWDEEEAPPPAAGVTIHPDDREQTLALLAATQAPTSRGVFDHEYRVIRPDGEVRWLAVHRQTFFSEPEPSPDRVALRAVGVVLDITERKQADELRDVFVGMLSHELRTPVTAIYGGSQVLRREHIDEATRQEIIGDIISESERLERLVENLLVLARAERHVDLASREPVLLRAVLSRVVADKRRRWPGSQIELEIEPGLPPVTSDDASVELILRNLISNALKYGEPSGIVQVTAERRDDAVVVRVSDDGPGVEASQVERLFDLFYRTDDARRRAGGAGIGLFVVRALVESAGGRVWAANRPGGGAEFTFELPVWIEADDLSGGE
jgi:PAS domain S-box-containing protein